MNKVMLVGFTTKKIEIKNINDKLFANFTVAVKRNYKNINGEYDTDFIQCVAVGHTAEFMSKYMNEEKSYRVALSGTIRTRNYTDDAGTKHYITEVFAESIENLTKTEKAEEVNVPGNYKTDYQESTITLSDSDLPF